MLARPIICMFLLFNIGCVSQSYLIRPREKTYSKRHLMKNYPDLVWLDDDGGKKDSGGGEGANCGSGSGSESGSGEGSKGCGQNGQNPLSKSDPKTKASNIAQKAAQEAKAANDAQVAAAEAAASQVKIELADKAVQAARAAEAALAGKQQIMEQLELEQREAEAVVQEVNTSLQNTQTNAAAANGAAGEAQNQLNQLKHLVDAATANMANIENVASGAQQELAEKTQLLEAARNRVDGLTRQLVAAKQDFEKTKKAAYKAACAAVEAKQKAQRNRRMLQENRHKDHLKLRPRSVKKFKRWSK